MGSDQPLDSDILVPADVDGDLIEWDGNDGHLNGILHEVGKYYERKTLFKPGRKPATQTRPRAVVEFCAAWLCVMGV